MNFEKEKLDILIQGGQSNAEGYGLGPVECEYVPCGEILYLVDDRTVEVLPRGVAFTGQSISESQKRATMWAMREYAVIFPWHLPGNMCKAAACRRIESC